jgi:hypothetical protein
MKKSKVSRSKWSAGCRRLPGVKDDTHRRRSAEEVKRGRDATKRHATKRLKVNTSSARMEGGAIPSVSAPWCARELEADD